MGLWGVKGLEELGGVRGLMGMRGLEGFAVTVTKNLRHPLLLQDLDVVWVLVQTPVLPPY